MSANIQARLERRSKSQQIADYYSILIDTGRILPGERLPGRAQIAWEWDVGAITAQQALRLLRDAGKVEAVRGHGSYARGG